MPVITINGPVGSGPIEVGQRVSQLLHINYVDRLVFAEAAKLVGSPVGVLIEEKKNVLQEYFAAVTYDGRAKKPVIMFSDMGGIDIEEVANSHPDHLSRTHFSAAKPFSPFTAKNAVSAVGVTGRELNQLSGIVTNLCKLFLERDLTLAEINPIGKLEDGSIIKIRVNIDRAGVATNYRNSDGSKHYNVQASMSVNVISSDRTYKLSKPGMKSDKSVVSKPYK